jgi:hypothetical protein
MVLVDDLRSFLDGCRAEVVRTSVAAVELLDRTRTRRLDELWLDRRPGWGKSGQVPGSLLYA